MDDCFVSCLVNSLLFLQIALAQVSTAPPYGHRRGWVPRTQQVLLLYMFSVYASTVMRVCKSCHRVIGHYMLTRAMILATQYINKTKLSLVELATAGRIHFSKVQLQ